MPDIRPVILSGGVGTRLWPLSTPTRPKQFAPLVAGGTLFGATLHRLRDLADVAGAIVVTGADHLDLVRGELADSPIPVGKVVVEPEGRNTAPAAIAAALLSEPSDVLVILPSDHLIRDVDAFHRAIGEAVGHADEDVIVMLGVRPGRVETGFGHIEMGPPVGSAHEVARFVEKPPAQQAQRFLAGEKHLWNAGIFVTRSEHLLAMAGQHCPDVLDTVRASLPERSDSEIRLHPGFAGAEAISIDHAIMEKAEKTLVVPFDAGWDDLGSYSSLLGASERDGDGNHVSGDVAIVDVSGSLVISTSRRVVVAGLDDVIVVETPDAVLVLPIDRAQDVGHLPRQKSSD